MTLSDAKYDRKFGKKKNVNTHIKLQHLQLCFVQQVSERLDVSFVFSDAALYYIRISPQAHGSPCWPTQPLFETSRFKRLSLRPRKMDIDPEP